MPYSPIAYKSSRMVVVAAAACCGTSFAQYVYSSVSTCFARIESSSTHACYHCHSYADSSTIPIMVSVSVPCIITYLSPEVSLFAIITIKAPVSVCVNELHARYKWHTHTHAHPGHILRFCRRYWQQQQHTLLYIHSLVHVNKIRYRHSYFASPECRRTCIYIQNNL